MTKLEAWKAWCESAGTPDLATEFTLEQSSHGKAFSFAWERGFVDGMQHQMRLSVEKVLEEKQEPSVDVRAWFTIDEINAWADKKLKENPQWAGQSAQRGPLTDKQIFEIWEEAMVKDNGKYARLDNQPFVHFALAIFRPKFVAELVVNHLLLVPVQGKSIQVTVMIHPLKQLLKRSCGHDCFCIVILV